MRYPGREPPWLRAHHLRGAATGHESRVDGCSASAAPARETTSGHARTRRDGLGTVPGWFVGNASKIARAGGRTYRSTLDRRHTQGKTNGNARLLAPSRDPNHIRDMKKHPFRLTPYQVQWLMVVGFVTVGYALYIRYLAIELSTVTLACDAGLQSYLCKARAVATYLFRNSVFGLVAVIVAVLHVIRPSIVLLTVGLVAAGAGIVLYNVALSGIAVGLLILGFARPAPATV